MQINFLKLIFISLIFFTYGVTVERLKIFPYKVLSQIFRIYREINVPRQLSTTSLNEKNPNDLVTPKVFVTYGQSNSANHGQIGYVSTKKTFMFLKGRIFLYKDPSLGATGMHGSVWGRLGDKLISRGYADSIVFASAGVSGASINQLSYGKNFNYFINQLKDAKKVFGKIDAILFHQGESNHMNNQGSLNYRKDFAHFLSNVRKYSDAPVYLSRASICDSSSDKELIKIQNNIIEEFDDVLSGPNTDLLINPKFRLTDKCHFSDLGFDYFADLWVEALDKK